MWLLPTKNRVLKLKDCLDTVLAADTTHPCLILIDHEDWKENQEEYKKLKGPKNWAFEITAHPGMADKVRDCWDKLEACEWVGILNDDHRVVTKNWDTMLVSHLNGKNFVSSNDRWMAPIKAATATAWSMPLLKCLGWPIYPPNFKHLFIDDVWETLGRSTGCWRPCMNVVVEHKHVIRGESQEDDTHRLVYNQKSWETDKATYDLWLKHDAQECVKKITEFQNQPSYKRYTPTIHKEVKNAPAQTSGQSDGVS